MIFLNAHSGLANRLRALISILVISKEINETVTLIWRKDNALNCDFYDLFQKNDLIKVQNYKFPYTLLEFYKTKNQIKKVIVNIIFRFSNINFCFSDKDVPTFVWDLGYFDLNKLPSNYKNLYFSTCNELWFREDVLELLKPIPELQIKILENYKNFNNNTIGLHIRRTDHVDSINASPLDLFIEIIQYELKKSANTIFFVSTDDKKVEDDLIKEFGTKIITHKKEFSRETTKGIQDALVDLYCLSKTTKIYGSFNSSFSSLAAKIGKIPLVIVEKNNLNFN